jgi:hypothetical protein
VKPLNAVTVVTEVSILPQPSSRLLAGAVIACELISVLPLILLGLVMGAKMGGPEMSERETANTCTTAGAALVRLTVNVCAVLVTGELT